MPPLRGPSKGPDGSSGQSQARTGFERAKAQAMTPDELAQALMWANEQIQPVLDFVDGIKADLTRRGWSTESVEMAGLQIFGSLVEGIFAGKGD